MPSKAGYDRLTVGGPTPRPGALAQRAARLGPWSLLIARGTSATSPVRRRPRRTRRRPRGLQRDPPARRYWLSHRHPRTRRVAAARFAPPAPSTPAGHASGLRSAAVGVCSTSRLRQSRRQRRARWSEPPELCVIEPDPLVRNWWRRGHVRVPLTSGNVCRASDRLIAHVLRGSPRPRYRSSWTDREKSACALGQGVDPMIKVY